MQLGDELEITVTVGSDACERRVGLPISDPARSPMRRRISSSATGATRARATASFTSARASTTGVADGTAIASAGPKLHDALQTRGTVLSEGTTTTRVGLRYQAEVQVAIGGDVDYTPGHPYTDTVTVSNPGPRGVTDVRVRHALSPICTGTAWSSRRPQRRATAPRSRTAPRPQLPAQLRGCLRRGVGRGQRRTMRYHWRSKGVRSFVDEPHAAINGQPGGTSST